MDPAAYIEMAQTESMHWWFSGRRAILSSIIERLELRPEAKILEVGCGTGGNLRMLAKFGEVSALEMDASARAIAANKTDNIYDVRAGHCPDNIPDYGTRFDLICMFDVLEHIDQDTETLIALRRLLAPHGRVLITVPSYQWLWSSHDRFLHHKRRYARSDLREKIKLSGLRPVKVSHFNTILFPFAVIGRIKDRLARDASATGTGVPASPVNNALRILFGSERYLLRHMNLPYGVSLLCVLEADHAL